MCNELTRDCMENLKKIGRGTSELESLTIYLLNRNC